MPISALHVQTIGGCATCDTYDMLDGASMFISAGFIFLDSQLRKLNTLALFTDASDFGEVCFKKPTSVQKLCIKTHEIELDILA